MKSLPFWFIMFASLFALAGMVFGIWMSIVQDHTLGPAHAHNNLIGFVTMALYGIYYRLVPAAAASPLATVHFWIALLGAVTFPVGLAMALTAQGEWLIQIASFAVVGAMLIFVFVVATNRAGLTNP